MTEDGDSAGGQAVLSLPLHRGVWKLALDNSDAGNMGSKKKIVLTYSIGLSCSLSLLAIIELGTKPRYTIVPRLMIP